MKIYTLGDSHCIAGFDAFAIPDVTIAVHHLGPKLMYSIGGDGFPLPLPFAPETHDWVILTFGEIDCRCHVKRFSEGIGFAACIDLFVSRFEAKVQQVALAIPCQIAIYNVPPPTSQSSIVIEHPEIPFAGEDHERRSYVLHMNLRLKEMCARNAWVFFDVDYQYCDENGYMSLTCSQDAVHIADPGPLESFIREWLLLRLL